MSTFVYNSCSCDFEADFLCTASPLSSEQIATFHSEDGTLSPIRWDYRDSPWYAFLAGMHAIRGSRTDVVRALFYKPTGGAAMMTTTQIVHLQDYAIKKRSHYRARSVLAAYQPIFDPDLELRANIGIIAADAAIQAAAGTYGHNMRAAAALAAGKAALQTERVRDALAVVARMKAAEGTGSPYHTATQGDLRRLMGTAKEAAATDSKMPDRQYGSVAEQYARIRPRCAGQEGLRRIRAGAKATAAAKKAALSNEAATAAEPAPRVSPDRRNEDQRKAIVDRMKGVGGWRYE